MVTSLTAQHKATSHFCNVVATMHFCRRQDNTTAGWMVVIGWDKVQYDVLISLNWKSKKDIGQLGIYLSQS